MKLCLIRYLLKKESLINGPKSKDNQRCKVEVGGRTVISQNIQMGMFLCYHGHFGKTPLGKIRKLCLFQFWPYFFHLSIPEIWRSYSNKSYVSEIRKSWTIILTSEFCFVVLASKLQFLLAFENRLNFGQISSNNSLMVFIYD